MVDRYYESDDPSSGHRLLIFDIEVEVTDGLPDTQLADNQITAISCYDDVSDEYFVFILDPEQKIDHVRTDNQEIMSFVAEEELLLAFLQKWEEVNPTIITGWNIDFFDVPYLYHRISNVLGKQEAKRLSPIGRVYFNKQRSRYFIAGVSSLDYFALYKQFTSNDQSSYTLDFISRTELGEGKVENPYGTLDEFRKKDLGGFIKYNLVDTVLVKKLDEKLNFLELVRGICHKGHVPYESVIYASRWIEGAMLVYLKKLNIVAPSKNPKNRDLMDGGTTSFSGAYVKEPIVGKYEWLYDLDFTSLYPSIVMTLNISPETKVGKIDGWDAETFLNDKSGEYFGHIGNDEGTLSGTQLDKLMKTYDYAISSNGVLYRKDKKGIIPQILEEWIKDKDNYDKLMKQYGHKGDKEKSEYYKQRRTISKVMLNSVYGVLGLPVFRFYDIDNAAAVTTTGVSLIQYSEKIANYYYNTTLETRDKDYVIYIDTDSLYLKAKPLIEKLYPDIDANDESQISKSMLHIVETVQQYLNNSFNLFCEKFLNITGEHNFDIKQEIIGRSGLWVAKKRYAIWITNESGVEKDEMMYKGLDVVRSSFPISFKIFLKELLTNILKNVPHDDIDTTVVNFKNAIRTLSIDDIAVPTSVKGVNKYGTKSRDKSKIFSNWIKGTPNHVKAAISYNEFLEFHKLDMAHVKILNSEKIKWVYLKTNPFGMDSVAIRGYDDPPELYEFILKYIDRNKMFEHILESKISDLYGALGWEIPSIEQKTIEKFFEF